MRRLQDPEIRERLRELAEQRAEDEALLVEEREWASGGPVGTVQQQRALVGPGLGDRGIIINPETEEVVWHDGQPYVVKKAKAAEGVWRDIPALSRWPWQRCKAKDWASAGTHGIALRCDRKKKHTGKHYVERAFQSYWFE